MLLDVYFDKFVPPFFLVFDGVELISVVAINIFDIADPVVDDSNRTAMHGRLNTTAAVMAAHYDMANLKCVHCEIKNTEEVQIRVHNHVCDISMDENLTRLGTDNYISRYSAIRATNPQDGWPLSLGLFDEIVWVNRNFRLNPLQIVVE